MYKTSGKLIELALNGRGRDIALLVAVNQLVQDSERIFDPVLTPESRRGLRVLGLVCGAIAEGKFDPAEFSAAAMRGQWARAFGSVSGLAKEIGASEGGTFSAMLGIVLVPTCYVDHFTLAAVRGIKISEVVCKRMSSESPSYKALCSNWVQRPTREALVRFVASGAAIDTRDPWLFDFRLGDETERARLWRSHRMLLFTGEHEEAYREVMLLVNQERWEKAEVVAASYFRQANAGPAESLTEAPALADFLAIALIHMWDPEEAVSACQTVGRQSQLGRRARRLQTPPAADL